MASELEPLLDDAAQKTAYYRYMAAGLHQAHQWRQAIDFYLKLLDIEGTKSALEKVERSLPRSPRLLGAGGWHAPPGRRPASGHCPG